MNKAHSIYQRTKRMKSEHFARTIRDYDNGIFEIDGFLDIIRYAGDDVMPILSFLESLKKIKIDEGGGNQNPFDLLKKAGYDAYLAKNLDEQNAILPYFEAEERLCTFKDPLRYKNYYIINAIKRGADKLNRADFVGKEAREDEYGTSVISIQILKTGGFISIKNRYNHTVDSPDNTFYSNPDRIISGLSCALKNYLMVDFSSVSEPVPNGYVFMNKRLYKTRFEAENIHFGDGFYLKDGMFFEVLKDYCLQVDELIVDFLNMRVLSVCESHNPLKKALEIELEGKKLQVRRDKTDANVRILSANGKDVLSVRDGRLISLTLYDVDELYDNFLANHPTIECVKGYNVSSMGDNCFSYCEKLKRVDLPMLENIADDMFLGSDAKVKAKTLFDKGYLFFNTLCLNTNTMKFENDGYVPNQLMDIIRSTMMMKKTFLEPPVFVDMGGGKQCIQFLDQPFLRFENGVMRGLHLYHKGAFLKNYVFRNIPFLQEVSAPEITSLGEGNFYECEGLEKLSLPKCNSISTRCVYNCPLLKEVDLNSLKRAGFLSISHNPNLKRIHLEQLEKTHHCCLGYSGFETLYLPNLVEMGEMCLMENKDLTKLYLPRLRTIGERGLSKLLKLKEIDLPALMYPYGNGILSQNFALEVVRLPGITTLTNNMLAECENLTKLYFNGLKILPEKVFSGLERLQVFSAPRVANLNKGVLEKTKDLRVVYMPCLDKKYHPQFIKRGFFLVKQKMFRRNLRGKDR